MTISEQCKSCGRPVEQVSNRRQREFCNATCRQRYHRAKQKPQEQDSVAAQTYVAMLAELEQLRGATYSQAQSILILQRENRTVSATVHDQAQTIEELRRENQRLRERLDVEKRYLADQQSRPFKSFLKNQPSSPFIAKFLADPQLLMPRDRRERYEYHLRRLKYSEEELQEFAQLWKLMLLSQP